MAAASLRDAGLHPVVLGRDPLAQLLQPQGAARLLVPAEELAAAQQLLGIAAVRPGEGGAPGAAGLESALATLCGLLILIVAYLSPASVPFLVGAVAIAALAAHRLRRRRQPED